MTSSAMIQHNSSSVRASEGPVNPYYPSINQASWVGAGGASSPSSEPADGGGAGQQWLSAAFAGVGKGQSCDNDGSFCRALHQGTELRWSGTKEQKAEAQGTPESQSVPAQQNQCWAGHCCPRDTWGLGRIAALVALSVKEHFMVSLVHLTLCPNLRCDNKGALPNMLRVNGMQIHLRHREASALPLLSLQGRCRLVWVSSHLARCGNILPTDPKFLLTQASCG